jgi:hypothetical protein
MPILVDATIIKGVIVLKKELDLEEQDVTIRIEPVHIEPALRTRICASLELVEEVLASEPDKFL